MRDKFEYVVPPYPTKEEIEERLDRAKRENPDGEIWYDKIKNRVFAKTEEKTNKNE